MNEFKPAKIRKILEEKGKELLFADADWYTDFCERYTHVTPTTRPNMHNAEIAVVGGIKQEEGISKVFDQLTGLVTPVAMLICKYFEFDDSYADIIVQVKSIPGN